jgi:cobalt-precorrin-5B (C1)-methyltransferase
VETIEIDLPAAPGVSFRVARCDVAPGRVTCGVIKDAGDDPDVTHGAEICATAEWAGQPGLRLEGGPGVGLVTLPGLPVPPGEPAINPAPRRLISRAVLAEVGDALANSLNECPDHLRPAGEITDEIKHTGCRGLLITIAVPEGQRLAAMTFNPRLGITGGISILGTTGIVRPYSQAAYRASIYLELKVAAANASPRAVLTTGRRSEAYVTALHPDWPAWAILDVGDHMDYALKQVKRLRFGEVVIAGMIGKISKLAQGRTRIHVDDGTVDLAFLAEVARAVGADESLAGRVRAANTAHHAQVLLAQAELPGLEDRLAHLAAHQVSGLLDGACDVEVLLYQLQGELLAKARVERRA